tara:strand:- start:44 stop:1696 length:1653 start_codon:yes stop_codon:yes gene_type:complete
MLLKIREEDRKEGTIGKETAANIGNFLKDQYERIPEDKRQGFEQGVSEAATGIQEWNKQLREKNYHGGIGPLDPFIAAGKAYNFVAEPIKKELSIQTGLAPEWIEAGEVAADFLLPAIPLTAASKGKKLKKAVDYTSALTVLDDTTLLNNKIRKILATNSQMSYGQARELALLELKGVHPTRKLYRDKPDRGGLMDGAPIDEQSMWDAQQRQLLIKKQPPIPKFGQTFVPPNPTEIHKVTQRLLNENVLYGKERRFNYNAFKGLYTGKSGSKKARQLEILMQTTPHSKIPNWNTHRQGLVDVFESLYGDVMSLKGITRSRIHIDHLVTLRSTMPIYDDVAFGSPLWNQIQETLLNSKKNYKPGNTLDNLNALDPGSHTVKTNFFNDRLGKDGELFFTKKRIAYMKKSDANRIEVLNDFIKIQDEGTEILNEATQVWETIYKPGTELPQQIVKKLAKIPVGKYSHPELKNLDELKRIVDDIVVAEGDRAIKNINKGYKLLSDRIKDPNLKMRVKPPTTLEKKLEKLGKPEGITKDTAQTNLFGQIDDILRD